MAVKHTDTGIVHSGVKGGTTGCGFNTNENPSEWVDSHSKITCEKNGCKNQPSLCKILFSSEQDLVI